MSAIIEREHLAGGTDLMERRRSGVATAVPQRFVVTDAMRGIAWRADGGATIGASMTIDALANDARIATAYPGLSAAASGLATPEIRRMATVGGNLTQRTRCWYFRNPALSCLKKGGNDCPARDGNHLYGVVFDRGPCVAPHPSTLGAALLAYDAIVETSARPALVVADVFGDGSDGTRDHLLAPDEIVRAIRLPHPASGERAVYRRAISRAHAEWTLVELIVRLVIDGDAIASSAVAYGGVAPVPLRMPAVEALLSGRKRNELDPTRIAATAIEGAQPLPMTGYKLALMQGLVRDALEALIRH